MSIVVAIDDLEPDQKRNNPRSKPGSAHTDFIKSSKDTPDAPSAYLVEHAPGRRSSAHYHANDQFQWEDVPDTWTCPGCSASKSDFEMVEI